MKSFILVLVFGIAAQTVFGVDLTSLPEVLRSKFTAYKLHLVFELFIFLKPNCEFFFSRFQIPPK